MDRPTYQEGVVEEDVDRTAFILTESHEFITNLLSYLPAKSLCHCARVCKTWNRIAVRLLKSRREMSWSCVNALEVSNSLLPNCDAQAHPMATFEVDMEECLKSIWSIPSHALVFTEFLTWKESARYNGSRSKASSQGLRTITEIMRSKLPEDCSLLTLHTPGTMGMKRNLKLLKESESEGGISCLFLPEMENVRIHQFSSVSGHHHDLIMEVCGGGNPSDVKCILLFGGSSRFYCQKAAEDLQKAFHEEVGRTPVIAGALVQAVEPSGVGGLVFSGTNVDAASVLLSESVQTRDEVKKQLASLKSLNLEGGGRRTVGFMFACIGRGLDHYCEENVESEVFRQCFPNTPLFGLFGNGEIGCENLSLMRDCGTESKGHHLPEVVHGYTTSVVLLSFK